MQNTKSIAEKQLISAIRSCLTSRKRQPNIVKVISLEESFKRLPISLIAKEVAFTITRTLSERLIVDHYFVAYRSTVLNDWENIAVVCTSKKVEKFSDITCIKCERALETNNKLFNNLLLSELNLIRRV